MSAGDNEAPSLVSKMTKGGIAVAALFCAGIVGSAWNSTVDRYPAEYVASKLLHISSRPKIALVFPQPRHGRYQEFYDGFMQEMNGHIASNIIDVIDPGESTPSEAWLAQTADKLRKRGDITHVLAIGTQATRAMHEANIPQGLMSALVSSPATFFNAVDETNIEFNRPIATRESCLTTLKVSAALARLTRPGPHEPTARLRVLCFADEESSRQIRQELASAGAAAAGLVWTFVPMLEDADVDDVLSRTRDDDTAFLVLHDRRALNLSPHIASFLRSRGTAFVTSYLDGVTSSVESSPVAAVGYRYEELGRESARQILHKLTDEKRFAEVHASTVDTAPALRLRIQLGVLRTLCAHNHVESPTLETLKSELAGLQLDPDCVEFVDT